MPARSHRRISRELLLGLGAVLMLALVFGAYNLGKGKGAAEAGSSANAGNRANVAIAGNGSDDHVKPVAPSAPPPPDAKAPLVVSTPTDAPGGSSTQPATGGLASAATTQPVGAPLLGAVATTPVLSAATATTQPAGNAQLAGLAGAQRSESHERTADRRPAAPDRALTGVPLADAKAKLDAGKLLDARRILNAAIAAKALSGDDLRLAKQQLNEINEVVVFSTKRFADDELGGTFSVPPGGALARIANRYEVSAELLMRINGITNAKSLQAGKDIKVIKGPFNAVVSKSEFTLELWLGEPETTSGVYVTSFPVGLGVDDSTPTGTWAVTDKVPNPAYYSPRGEGIIDADDPKNPLGEHWIALTGTDGHALGKKSYGIHGTIDPASIGKQESMGCIRLTNENVARVYEVLARGKSTVLVKE